MEAFVVELNAIDMQAKDGKLDPRKIQIENVVVHLVKQKFATLHS
jgi:hypothetical protein